ncbi:MAG: hypothetical protein WDM79_01070 [Terricaulis sp.]
MSAAIGALAVFGFVGIASAQGADQAGDNTTTARLTAGQSVQARSPRLATRIGFVSAFNRDNFIASRSTARARPRSAIRCSSFMAPMAKSWRATMTAMG